MNLVAATPRPAEGAEPLWKAPGLAIERAADWGQMSVAVFQRGGDGGDGASRSPWHRIVLSPALVGPVALSLDGGPTRRFTPQPGTLGFHPAGAEVSVSHGPGRVIQISQDPLLYRGVMSEIGGRGDLAVTPIINFADPLVAQIARSLASEVGGSGPADRLLVDGLSVALAARVARRLVRREPPDANGRALSRERLRRVLDHIEAHLGEDLSLAELAGVACLSPFHFSRCFKRAVGVGPRRYINCRKVERAQELVRRTDQPLAAIAQALGYADQSHFTNAFRTETGSTPARFRAAVA
jgi:AraC family transcriptional regulator